ESYALYLRRALAHARPQLRGGELQLLAARRYESFMFTPYARTVVVSDRDRDELLSLNPSLPVEVIPNGVDTYAFRPRPTARIPALLFVGNYEYPPNVDAALHLAQDIFPIVRQRLPQTRLWLVGNAPPPELRALASESIRVTGRVPDVRPYLARAGAFISPLRLGAGIKNKVLEALSMGCPVIATPLSLDGIAARDGHESLVAEGPALAEAALRLLQDADLSRQLSLNGRRLIESRYSWDHVAERYLALYAALAPQSHSPPPPSRL
ncbi:MAG: glycosyltransferase, partial [Anaerolineae bacterium]|nr:glycosyltransferase [Anaerolineae bacterium]